MEATIKYAIRHEISAKRWRPQCCKKFSKKIIIWKIGDDTTNKRRENILSQEENISHMQKSNLKIVMTNIIKAYVITVITQINTEVPHIVFVI